MSIESEFTEVPRQRISDALQPHVAHAHHKPARMVDDPFGRAALDLFASSKTATTILERIQSLPVLEGHPTTGRAPGPIDIATAPRLDIRIPPYNYGDGVGTTSSSADPDGGGMSINCAAGNIQTADGDVAAAKAWVGIELFSSQAVDVRVSSLIDWNSYWRLAVAGFAFLGSSPYARWEINVQAQAYDTQGAVSGLSDQQVLKRLKEGAPGLDGWDADDDWSGGRANAMQTFVSIPAGQAKWFNVILSGSLQCHSTWQSSAAGFGHAGVSVPLIVVERL